MVMYIVPPYRPHRSLIGQPIIGVGSIISFSTYSSPGSSPTSGSSSSNTSRSRRTKSSSTYYPTGLSSASTNPSRNPPCPPAYDNRRLRRRDNFGIGEATMSTTATTSRRTEMPFERIPAFVWEERHSGYDNYNSNYDDDYDYYKDGGGRHYQRGREREFRYSRRNGEHRLRSFSEHARSSGRRDLIDLMQFASDEDDENLSWRYCRSY